MKHIGTRDVMSYVNIKTDICGWCGNKLCDAQKFNMKEELIRKFVEKLDYSYNYKTVNERQNIINDLCKIAEIEQLIIPAVMKSQYRWVCGKCDFTSTKLDWNKCPNCGNVP